MGPVTTTGKRVTRHRRAYLAIGSFFGFLFFLKESYAELYKSTLLVIRNPESGFLADILPGVINKRSMR